MEFSQFRSLEIWKRAHPCLEEDCVELFAVVELLILLLGVVGVKGVVDCKVLFEFPFVVVEDNEEGVVVAGGVVDVDWKVADPPN